jgi:outer membrane receptor for ferrienterochelin and colicins
MSIGNVEIKLSAGVQTILLFLIVILAFEKPVQAETQTQVVPDITELSISELMNLEVETVYGASRFEQKITEAPSSVSIVTAEEIKRFGYRTLAEVLNGVKSFYISYDRNFSYAGVRGFGRAGDFNDRILILVDGNKMNDNITTGAFIGTDFPIDIELIERIEVIRGPGSSIYGSNAFFAVINVITRDSNNLKGIEFSSDVGSYGTYKERISYGKKFQSGFELITSGTWYTSSGQDLYFSAFDNPATNNGIAQGIDFDRHQSVFLSLSNQDIVIEGGYSARTKGVPTGYYQTDFNDPNNQTVIARIFSDLKYEKNLNKRSSIMVRAYYDKFDYTGDFINLGIDTRDNENGEWFGGELKYSIDLDEIHKVSLGAEYQDNIKQLQQTYRVAPYIPDLNDNTTSQVSALYFQDEITLLKNLLVNFGGRYDHYTTFGGTFNPRVAVVYSPYDSSRLKLIYGTAFRAPNNLELYLTVSSGPQGNPNLSPEKIEQVELVYEQYWSHHIRTSISGFHYKISDLISQTLDPTNTFLVFENIDEINAAGLELEIEKKSINGIEARASYSYQDVERELTADDIKRGITDETLTNAPHQVAKILLSTPIWSDSVRASVEEEYVGKRLICYGCGSAPEYFLTNLTFYDQSLMVKGLDISASIYNLFDVSYGTPGGPEQVQSLIQQDGRNYRLKLTFAF